jgi:hypothetical protein
MPPELDEMDDDKGIDNDKCGDDADADDADADDDKGIDNDKCGVADDEDDNDDDAAYMRDELDITDEDEEIELE